MATSKLSGAKGIASAVGLCLGCCFNAGGDAEKAYGVTYVDKRNFSLLLGLSNSCAFLRKQYIIDRPFREDVFSAEDQEWAFTDARGAAAAVDVRNPRLRSGNAEVRLRAAVAGLGVARITATFCAQAVARGELVPLLPQWTCEPLKMHALLPGRRLVAAKVRLFLDWLEQEASGAL